MKKVVVFLILILIISIGLNIYFSLSGSVFNKISNSTFITCYEDSLRSNKYLCTGFIKDGTKFNFNFALDDGYLPIPNDVIPNTFRLYPPVIL